jgi:signal transduction histidine kinase
MHALLKRQLKRFIGNDATDLDALPSPWREFVSAVNEAYKAYAADHELNERSMELVSLELTDRNALLIEKNAELLVAMERAESASTAKSAFLANMSHEIRTPMSAILGYADMLLAEGHTQEQRLECVATIRQQGKHLLAILNDILDLSKIEAEQLDVERIECDPGRVIGEALSLMKVRAAERNIECSVTYLGLMPNAIRTDPTRLRQILLNLIGNAIKFTEAGGVQVVASVEHDSIDNTARLRVEVIDSGIGMTPEQLENLFKPFVQGDASTTRRFGGTGLGLSVSKRLANLLGGDICAQSRPGAGSRFILTADAGDLRDVPHSFHTQAGVRRLATPEPPSTPVVSTNEGPLRGRILLAEDGVLNQRVFRYYLESLGAQVEWAENGQIAVEMAETARSRGEPFDLILMDMQDAPARWLRSRHASQEPGLHCPDYCPDRKCDDR